MALRLLFVSSSSSSSLADESTQSQSVQSIKALLLESSADEQRVLECSVYYIAATQGSKEPVSGVSILSFCLR